MGGEKGEGGIWGGERGGGGIGEVGEMRRLGTNNTVWSIPARESATEPANKRNNRRRRRKKMKSRK